MNHDTSENDEHGQRINRRALLAGCGAAVAVAGTAGIRHALARRENVFLAGNQHYDGDLAGTIRDGLAAVGFSLASMRGKRVLLKPNLVEPSRDSPQMTTNPAVILAAAEVFLRAGAKVSTGEAPGHVRDSQMALLDSGVGEAIRQERLQFADLNYEDSAPVRNAGGVSKLTEIFFPRSVHEADLVVSLPKLKTHHWVGMTAAMKNLYGLLPGIKYGWPKNVLHFAGIPQSVVDINASAPRTIGIVDAIQCMEGDGPIMGGSKHLGVLAVGTNLPSLDATCARLMGLEPERISYLSLGRQLGPIADWQIDQRGTRWQDLASPFEIMDVPHLQELRADRSGILISQAKPRGCQLQHV